MDKTIAENLIVELSKHPRIIPLDKDFFIKILISMDVPESSRFYENLPDKEQTLQDGDNFYLLSLRRILRNNNAQDYKMSKWKNIYKSIISSSGAYSSDVLTRNLRADKDLVKIMSECEQPFSLLGKFKSYDINNSYNGISTIIRPILVIPGAMDSVLKWEEANIIYDKEGLFLNGPSRLLKFL